MDEQPANKKNLEISAETEIMFKNFVQLVLPTNGTPKQRAEWRKRMTALPMQQDVDFLAVNEINTSETANMIASMMMQGTSGISSIHGSGHGDAINRLKNPDELGVSAQILFSGSFFNMVIYQTLVGKLCKNCSLSEHPVGFWNAQLKTQFGERAKKFKFHNPEGCKECEINGRRLGVVGRTLVAEVIPVSQDNRSFLRTPEDSQPMRDWLKETGRDTIHMHALKLALGGIIDPVVIQQKIGHFSKFNLFDKIINLDEKKELKRLEQGKD
jgi:type II secretory ATPase GspE/PulE/Tfp pilus assembly ATPase PilB-like protein